MGFLAKFHLKKFLDYVKDYGKPNPEEEFSMFGVFVGTLIVLGITWAFVHFGYTWLCLFLIGEYKENFEYWRYGLTHNV